MFNMLISAFRTGNFDMMTLLSYFVAAVVIIFIAMPVHEWAHAFTAYKLGDPTPKYSGRLTLNPLAHINYIGALLIILFGFGWAQPVEINQRNFKNPKKGMAISALAGPLSNIIMAFIFYVIWKIIPASLTGISYYIITLVQYIVIINISLAVFNLIPIPPLDGSRLLAAFLPDRVYYRLMQYERYFFIIIVALLFLGVLDIPLQYLQMGIFWLFDKLTFFIK